MIVIDEAHLLENSPMLETLRMLLNFGPDGKPGMTLFSWASPASCRFWIARRNWRSGWA